MIITNIEQQKKNKGRSSVFLDDKFSFGIDDFDLLKLKLKIGMELTDDQLNEIKETILLSSAKEYSVGLVSKFSYTKKTMTDKLRSRDYDNETIEKTIRFLENYNFIDDLEYAKRFINDALKIKHFGLKKIKYDLLQKGINNNVIEEALSDFDIDTLEENGILSLARKKIGGNFEYKNIMKTKRYLASKGYSFELVDKTIDFIIHEERE